MTLDQHKLNRQTRALNYEYLPSLDVICKGHHADGLPDTQPNSGCDTTVQTLNAVLTINVSESVEDSRLCGTLRVGRLLDHGLHLNANDFNRLVPCPERATCGKHTSVSRSSATKIGLHTKSGTGNFVDSS